ncbi:HK97 gp10 family phage protein [Enterocloster alcoholdehydrogenati]|uniref:HK97 gp10 family phage protein n=1 Tax=Enterocloster alcoholdehydrogenati TaxID=2547410 RepID=UPI001592C698|nr:HK97 gp10 family phage protein [Enterocloster alcoholdehydrogenati]
MSSFGSQMRKRLDELRRAGQDVPKIMAEVVEGATIEAVRVATENTPPNDGTIAGTNMRSGEMAQHWATDSQITPIIMGRSVRTELSNYMQYASYVNDGHRVDKHFVPGLIKNGSLLERSPNGSGGLMVGTKTTYVKGKYMKQKANGKYRDVVRTELDKRVREAFK